MNPRGGRLWIVWFVLILLIAVIIYLQKREDADSAGGDGHGHVAAESRMLLPVAVAELGAIEIAHEGTMHRFERDAIGNWFYHGTHAGNQAEHGHPMDPTLSERIGKAFAGLDKARKERDAPYDKNKDLFGVVVPKIIFLVYRPNETQPLAQYAVGDIAPDTHSRYVHQVGSPKVVTLPEYHIQNLLSVIRMVAMPPLAVPLSVPPAPAK